MVVTEQQMFSNTELKLFFWKIKLSETNLWKSGKRIWCTFSEQAESALFFTFFWAASSCTCSFLVLLAKKSFLAVWRLFHWHELQVPDDWNKLLRRQKWLNIKWPIFPENMEQPVQYSMGRARDECQCLSTPVFLLSSSPWRTFSSMQLYFTQV